jgi:chorismate mutase
MQNRQSLEEKVMQNKLENIRKEIDKIDDEIISLLSKRNDLIRGIAKIKKELNKPVLDEKREKEIIERLKTTAKEKGLDESLIDSIFKTIMKNSRNNQEKDK